MRRLTPRNGARGRADTCESLTEKLADLRFALKRIEYDADPDLTVERIEARYGRCAADVVAGVYMRKLC